VLGPGECFGEEELFLEKGVCLRRFYNAKCSSEAILLYVIKRIDIMKKFNHDEVI
jgi:CRP-like cAMP-binding protein